MSQSLSSAGNITKGDPDIAAKIGYSMRPSGIGLDQLSTRSLYIVQLNHATLSLPDVIYEPSLKSRYDGLHKPFTERQPDLPIMPSFSSA